jgi:hypothetical protein
MDAARIAATAPELSAPELVVAPAPELTHDLDAERRILSAILSDNALYPSVRDILRPEHFSDLHGFIYRMSRRLIERGRPATVAALGGSEFVQGLAGCVYALDVKEDARRLRELYFERERIAAKICTAVGDKDESDRSSPFCPDIDAEFSNAIDCVERQDFNALVAAGVPTSLVWGSLRFGVATIECASDGTYQPSGDGRRAIILPDHPIAGDDAWQGDNELIAFALDDPQRWYCRLGGAPLLNPYAAERALGWLRVSSTPLAWLVVGGDGVCVIDWDCRLPLHFRADVKLIADTGDLAERLERALRPIERTKNSILMGGGARSS